MWPLKDEGTDDGKLMQVTFGSLRARLSPETFLCVSQGLSACSLLLLWPPSPSLFSLRGGGGGLLLLSCLHCAVTSPLLKVLSVSSCISCLLLNSRY